MLKRACIILGWLLIATFTLSGFVYTPGGKEPYWFIWLMCLMCLIIVGFVSYFMVWSAEEWDK